MMGHVASPFDALVVQWGDEDDTRRTVLVKIHSGDEEDIATIGTNAIFVTGIAWSLAKEETLRAIFSNFGTLQKIAMHPSKVMSFGKTHRF